MNFVFHRKVKKNRKVKEQTSLSARLSVWTAVKKNCCSATPLKRTRGLSRENKVCPGFSLHHYFSYQMGHKPLVRTTIMNQSSSE